MTSPRVAENQHLAEMTAKRFVREHRSLVDHYEDLRQEAAIGLCIADATFDASRASWSTYAFNRMWWQMLEYQRLVYRYAISDEDDEERAEEIDPAISPERAAVIQDAAEKATKALEQIAFSQNASAYARRQGSRMANGDRNVRIFLNRLLREEFEKGVLLDAIQKFDLTKEGIRFAEKSVAKDFERWANDVRQEAEAA